MCAICFNSVILIGSILNWKSCPFIIPYPEVCAKSWVTEDAIEESNLKFQQIKMTQISVHTIF